MRHFLELSDLTESRREAVLARARQLEQQPVCAALVGKVVGLVFMNPSLRTLASMESGIAQLGGRSFVITPGQSSWKLELRDGIVMDGEAIEHVREAIPVLASYADALAVRCFADGKSLENDLADRAMRTIASLCEVPFINLESAVSHPCQALADWKTLDDLNVPRQGGRFVLSWAYHPKPLPYAVPASVLGMASLRGMDVTILRPDGYDLPDAILQRARQLAQQSGGSIRLSSDRRDALQGAHVLYAKSWAAPDCYGSPTDEVERREALRSWCVDESWFAPARSDARFMHCLPVRRNVKVADEVLDGPRSVVLPQAANRLHVQKSLLMELFLGEDG